LAVIIAMNPFDGNAKNDLSKRSTHIMIDRRKNSGKNKDGIVARGSSNRLKLQSIESRVGRRSEVTKRFRGVDVVAGENSFESYSVAALQKIVLAVKVQGFILRRMKMISRLIQELFLADYR
jgi:hypothetical protein